MLLGGSNKDVVAHSENTHWEAEAERILAENNAWVSSVVAMFLGDKAKEVSPTKS